MAAHIAAKIVLKLKLPESAKEDIIQEALLKFHQIWAKSESPTYSKAFITEEVEKATKNAAIEYYSKVDSFIKKTTEIIDGEQFPLKKRSSPSFDSLPDEEEVWDIISSDELPGNLSTRSPEELLIASQEELEMASREEREELRMASVSKLFQVVMESLSELEMQVFRLRETNNFKYHKIAKLLGIQEATARQRFQRAKKKIRRSLEMYRFGNI